MSGTLEITATTTVAKTAPPMMDHALIPNDDSCDGSLGVMTDDLSC